MSFMDKQALDLWQAIILAIIEGLTEYLPVSSTGHIILGSAAMGIEGDQFVKDYTVIVQFGAILSVLVVYRERFRAALKEAGRRTLALYFAAFLPAAFFGLLLGKKIDAWLGDVAVVGWSLLIGGIILLGLDRFEVMIHKHNHQRSNGRWKREDDALKIPFTHAIGIGFSQCLALIPGVSRSGASIAGALGFGYTRKTAAEFSFFLAVPTLSAASGYKLLKMGDAFNWDTAPVIVIGNLASFFVGILAIKSFIGFLQRHGFFWFGIYRILVGGCILLLLASGYSLKMVD
jgi:undecaprenyl-diphosphatase